MSPAVAARPTGAAGRIERRGVIASVTLPGADEATVFRAVLADRLPAPGSMAPAETLQLVWHGRRRVPGDAMRSARRPGPGRPRRSSGDGR